MSQAQEVLPAQPAHPGRHPKALFVLFFTDMWERFAYYLMVGILLIYMTDSTTGGKGFSGRIGADIVGSFIALVYLTPFIGGLIADRYLGYIKSIFLGGSLMAAGYLGLSLPGDTAMFISLALIIVGNGFFKPNALIGLKALLWTLDNIEWGMTAPPVRSMPPALIRLFPFIGLAIAVTVLVWAARWYGSDNQRLAARAVIIVPGFAMGFVMHRSRICFARAFREPFMTGEGTMTRAIMVGILIGVPMAALLFKAKTIDPYIAIPTVFWIGSLVGGVIFGVGMIFAGGCASGALWRMGEGHLKLWVATFFFAWSGSIAYAVLKKTGLTVSEDNLDDPFNGLMTKLGVQTFLPNSLGGWGAAFAVAAILLLLWYAFVPHDDEHARPFRFRS